MKKLNIFALTSIVALTAGVSAAQADKLTLYCSADDEFCQVLARGFEAATGIDVNMTRKSSGETFAQLKAEASNPKGDVWWGGTGDPHLQAAEEGLTQAYVSQARDQLFDWANRQAAASKDRTVGIYSGALGYGYNEELLKKQGLSAPGCWKDLIKPEFKGKVQVANPNSSGTSYTMLATLVQMMGEKEAFDYLRALHKNINQYTKSGAAPARAAGAIELAQRAAMGPKGKFGPFGGDEPSRLGRVVAGAQPSADHAPTVDQQDHRRTGVAAGAVGAVQTIDLDAQAGFLPRLANRGEGERDREVRRAALGQSRQACGGGGVELVGQRVDRRELLLAGRAARPAHHHEGGVGPTQVGQGPHGDVEPLERLDPPDEQDDRLRAERQGAAGAVAGTG